MTKKGACVSFRPSPAQNLDGTTKLDASRLISWKKLRVYYDESAHRDFVTGFRRRKAERRAQAKRQQEEKEHVQRVQEKREKRRILMSLREGFQDEMNEGEEEEGTQEGRTVTEYGDVSVVVEKMETPGEREWRLMELKERGERTTRAYPDAGESLKKQPCDEGLGDAGTGRGAIKMDREKAKVKKSWKSVTSGRRKITKRRRTRVNGSRSNVRSRKAEFRKRGMG